MFARLRGVPEKQIKEVVEVEINRLDLKKHANKRCEKYRLVNVTQYHCRWFNSKSYLGEPKRACTSAPLEKIAVPLCACLHMNLLPHTMLFTQCCIVNYVTLAQLPKIQCLVLLTQTHRHTYSIIVSNFAIAVVETSVNCAQPLLSLAILPLSCWTNQPLDWIQLLSATSGMC